MLYRVTRRYLFGVLRGQYQTLTSRYPVTVGYEVLCPSSGACPYRVVFCEEVRKSSR